jgi:serine/threonine protein kinase
VIRIDHSSTTEDEIDKEVAVILKICMSGHQNIVQVLRDDWFESENDYFIDMELCSLTLHDYINDRPTFVNRTPDLLNNPTFVEDDCSAHLKLLNIWTIVSHVAQGLAFIHRERYTHRDIKPLNSKWNK